MLDGALLAGAGAGSLAVIELANATRKPPALRALGWIAVLFGFDAASGLLAYALVTEALKGLTWFVGAWPIVLSAIAGPALLRSQLALLGSGQESTYYGPANRYRRIQKQIEQKIDQLSAAAQSDWVARIIPKISKISIDELTLRVTTYVKALDSLDDAKRQQLLTYFEETAVDATIDHPQKCRYIVQKLVDNDCRQCLRTLVRRSKQLGCDARKDES